MSAAGTWQPTTGYALPEEATLLRRIGVRARSVAADCRNAPRYCLKYGTAVLAIFGLLQLWQASGDGPIPTFHSLRPAAELDPFRTSHPQCVFSARDEAARWQGLMPAMAILSHVNPEVAAWIRQTRRDGKLHFAQGVKAGKHPVSQLAQYDALRGRLTIASGLFAENDGTIAAVLCHEYRHSRQRVPKTVVYALSFLWKEGGDPALIENDALLYEQEANLAIFGAYRDI
ncbi:MAG: hypothetical protein GX575_16930 [Candidatus Anammoximicrobium sp.]|nr:hypothetical protein [Candidatus Anammoximicrobium sp.]